MTGNVSGWHDGVCCYLVGEDRTNTKHHARRYKSPRLQSVSWPPTQQRIGHFCSTWITRWLFSILDHGKIIEVRLFTSKHRLWFLFFQNTFLKLRSNYMQILSNWPVVYLRKGKEQGAARTQERRQQKHAFHSIAAYPSRLGLFINTGKPFLRG